MELLAGHVLQYLDSKIQETSFIEIFYTIF